MLCHESWFQDDIENQFHGGGGRRSKYSNSWTLTTSTRKILDENLQL